MIRFYNTDSIQACNQINQSGGSAFNRDTVRYLYSSSGIAPLVDKINKIKMTQVNGSFVGGDPLLTRTFFPNATGYLSLTDNGAIDLDSLTWTFRIRHTQVTSTVQSVMAVVNDGSTMAMQFLCDTQDGGTYSAGSFFIFIRDNSGNRLSGRFTNTSINGNWRNISVVVANNTIKAFVDGVSQSITHISQESPSSFVSWAYPIYIGARDLRGTADLFMRGRVSLACFDDQPLSDAEVVKLHRNLKKNLTTEIRLPYWFAPSGGGAFTQSVSGSITASGALTDILNAVESVSGSSTSSGVLTVKVGKNLSGSITSSGSLVKKQFKTLTGSVTSSGTVATRQFVGKLNEGSITPSGTLTLSIKYNLDGSITATGLLTKKTLKSLSGSVTGSGVETNTQFIDLSGSITPSGTVSPSSPFTPAPSAPSQGTSSSLIQRLRRRWWI